MTTTSDAEKIAVFDALATLDPKLFLENTSYFTCTEAEAIALFVMAAYGEEMSADFLRGHAWWDDDENDLHNPDGTLRTSRTSVIDKEMK